MRPSTFYWNLSKPSYKIIIIFKIENECGNTAKCKNQSDVRGNKMQYLIFLLAKPWTSMSAALWWRSCNAPQASSTFHGSAEHTVDMAIHHQGASQPAHQFYWSVVICKTCLTQFWYIPWSQKVFPSSGAHILAIKPVWTKAEDEKLQIPGRTSGDVHETREGRWSM